MNRLAIKGINKRFKQRQVVDSVSFSIESGKVVGLLGPNGAGKTTSFYMVVGILPPDRGQIVLNDQDISRMPVYQRARVGLSYLPQEASVFRRLTVKENIMVGLEAAEVPPSEMEDRVQQLLQDFNIGHVSESYGYSLSGGERRRVEIARSLAGSPKFLLLDEPFAGIDPIAVGDIQNIIRDLKAQGLGILITDHNVRETLGICDYAYILREGRIEVEGSAEQIANSEIARKFYLGENFKL
jgi:lipopolysaccharide export system ATP-binding protein